MEAQSSQPTPLGVLAAHAGDGCLATASLSHWHVSRRSGLRCVARAVARAGLQGHRQYAPLLFPVAEAGPQSLRRVPMPAFEPPIWMRVSIVNRHSDIGMLLAVSMPVSFRVFLQLQFVGAMIIAAGPGLVANCDLP
jgi:hypothetical protein